MVYEPRYLAILQALGPNARRLQRVNAAYEAHRELYSASPAALEPDALFDAADGLRESFENLRQLVKKTDALVSEWQEATHLLPDDERRAAEETKIRYKQQHGDFEALLEVAKVNVSHAQERMPAYLDTARAHGFAEVEVQPEEATMHSLPQPFADLGYAYRVQTPTTTVMTVTSANTLTTSATPFPPTVAADPFRLPPAGGYVPSTTTASGLPNVSAQPTLGVQPTYAQLSVPQLTRPHAVYAPYVRQSMFEQPAQAQVTAVHQHQLVPPPLAARPRTQPMPPYAAANWATNGPPLPARITQRLYRMDSTMSRPPSVLFVQLKTILDGEANHAIVRRNHTEAFGSLAHRVDDNSRRQRSTPRLSPHRHGDTRRRALSPIATPRYRSPRRPDGRDDLHTHLAVSIREDANGPCHLCDGIHVTYKCPHFAKPSARRERAVERNLCFNCLNKGHRVTDCPSRGSCRKCQGKHHTSICRQQRSDSLSSNEGNQQKSDDN